MNQMTTVEAREVLKEIKSLFRHVSLSTTESKALEVAIEALEKPSPMYHYLPEVPADWEDVICYVDNLDFGVEAIYRSMSEYKLPSYFETRDGDYIKPYAWCRKPPKPPVKPTEEK